MCCYDESKELLCNSNPDSVRDVIVSATELQDAAEKWRKYDRVKLGQSPVNRLAGLLISQAVATQDHRHDHVGELAVTAVKALNHLADAGVEMSYDEWVKWIADRFCKKAVERREIDAFRANTAYKRALARGVGPTSGSGGPTSSPDVTDAATRNATERISEPVWTIVHMRRTGATWKKIAEYIGLPERTLKARYANAVAHIQRCLDSHYGQEPPQLA